MESLDTIKKCLRHWPKSCGGHGSFSNMHSGTGASAGTAGGMDTNEVATWKVFPKPGGGIYFYGTINRNAADYFGSEPYAYSVEVFYTEDGELNYNGMPICTTGAYIAHIEEEPIEELGGAISHVFYPAAGSEIYINMKVHGSEDYVYAYNPYYVPDMLSPPYNISYDGTAINFTCDPNSGTTACEFKTDETDYPYSTYPDEARALFYEAACQATEFGLETKFGKNTLFRFEKREVTIGVNFMSSVSSSKRADFRGYVEQVVNIINNTVYGSGFSLKIIDGITNGTYQKAADRAGKGEIQLWWGNYKELWNKNKPTSVGEFIYFGTWENNAYSNNATYLTEGIVRLCTEPFWQMNFQGITYEEIVECLGAGNDVRHTAQSAYSEFWYPNKSLDSNLRLSPAENDLYVLELLYNYDIPSKTKNEEIARMINAPNGHGTYYGHRNPGKIDLSFLESEKTYKVRLISTENEETSLYTPWITIKKPGRPEYFEWDTMKIAGRPFDLTASEWNALTDNINAVRVYKGLAEYSFSHAFTGGAVTAAIYNEARTAIRQLPGVTEAIPTAGKGRVVKADYLNKLRDILNSIK